jgi:hypothetical protein
MVAEFWLGCERKVMKLERSGAIITEYFRSSIENAKLLSPLSYPRAMVLRALLTERTLPTIKGNIVLRGLIILILLLIPFSFDILILAHNALLVVVLLPIVISILSTILCSHLCIYLALSTILQ